MSTKRKVDRACDACRRKKTRCNGSLMPDNVCSNCAQSRKECTYLEMSKPRGPPKAYVTGLEDEVERLEALLEELYPGRDFSSELGPPVVRDSWKEDDNNSFKNMSPKTLSASNLSRSNSTDFAVRSSSTSRQSSHTLPSNTRTRPPARTTRVSRTSCQRQNEDSSDSEDEGEVSTLSAAKGPKHLTFRGLKPVYSQKSSRLDGQMRFHDQSSGLQYVGEARRLKRMYSKFPKPHNTDSGDSCMSDCPEMSGRRARRLQFWSTPPWELAWEGVYLDVKDLLNNHIEFPPPDLASDLIDLFFKNMNVYYPLFHRPTFDKHWQQGLHYRNPSFAGVVLSVFAVASRWSFDERCISKVTFDIDGEYLQDSRGGKWHRAGWHWYWASYYTHIYTYSLFLPTSLFEIQKYAVWAMFLQGSAPYQDSARCFISIGIRKSQDVGAHRKTMYSSKPSVEEELWKRAFWILVTFDRMDSARRKQHCYTQPDDFDLPYPLEVDDEYWITEDPLQAFLQPRGKPSVITVFVLILKMMEMMSFTLKLIYTVDHSKIMTRNIPVEKIVAQIHRRLDDYLDSIPEYLKWPNLKHDTTFSRQSATLYISYYFNLIMLYQPFITSSHPPKASPKLSVAPLEFCATAASSLSRIVATQLQSKAPNITSILAAVPVCVTALSTELSELKEPLPTRGIGDVESKSAQIASHIEICFDALRIFQEKWELASHYFSTLVRAFNNTDNKRSFLPLPELKVFTPMVSYSDNNRHVPIQQALHQSVYGYGRRSMEMDYGFPQVQKMLGLTHSAPRDYTMPETQLGFANGMNERNISSDHRKNMNDEFVQWRPGRDQYIPPLLPGAPYGHSLRSSYEGRLQDRHCT